MIRDFVESGDWEGWTFVGGKGSVTKGGPEAVELDEGDVFLMLDGVGFNFYVDAIPDPDPTTMRRLFDMLGRLGLALVDDGECEPLDLRSGHIRRYLVPTWD